MSTPRAEPATKRTPVNVWKPAFLEALAATGNATLAARAVGIDRTTAYKNRSRSKVFAAAWDAAIEEATDILIAETRRRGFAGWDEPVWYQGEVVGTVRKYDSSLLKTLLEAYRPSMFRSNYKVEHSGQIDGSGAVPRIEILFADPRTDELPPGAEVIEAGAVRDDDA